MGNSRNIGKMLRAGQPKRRINVYSDALTLRCYPLPSQRFILGDDDDDDGG